MLKQKQDYNKLSSKFYSIIKLIQDNSYKKAVIFYEKDNDVGRRQLLTLCHHINSKIYVYNEYRQEFPRNDENWIWIMNYLTPDKPNNLSCIPSLDAVIFYEKHPLEEYMEYSRHLISPSCCATYVENDSGEEYYNQISIDDYVQELSNDNELESIGYNNEK